MCRAESHFSGSSQAFTFRCSEQVSIWAPSSRLSHDSLGAFHLPLPRLRHLQTEEISAWAAPASLEVVGLVCGVCNTYFMQLAGHITFSHWYHHVPSAAAAAVAACRWLTMMLRKVWQIHYCYPIDAVKRSQPRQCPSVTSGEHPGSVLQGADARVLHPEPDYIF